MLQARLELAPRVNPDWILSPTRLPIPPLERGIFSCHDLSGIGRLVYLPSHKRYLIVCSAECHWSAVLLYSIFNLQPVTESVPFPPFLKYLILKRSPCHWSLLNFQQKYNITDILKCLVIFYRDIAKNFFRGFYLEEVI